MDAYSRYNQIPMYEPDEEHTSFITNRGLYYYNAIRPQEYRSDLLETYKHDIQGSDRENYGAIRGRHVSQVQKARNHIEHLK